MSAKQIIKSIVPKSAWKKARSIKDTMEASKARRIPAVVPEGLRT